MLTNDDVHMRMDIIEGKLDALLAPGSTKENEKLSQQPGYAPSSSPVTCKYRRDDAMKRSSVRYSRLGTYYIHISTYIPSCTILPL